MHDQARVSSDAVFHSDELRYASDDESEDQTYLEYDDFDNDDLRMCLPHLRQCFCGIEAVAGIHVYVFVEQLRVSGCLFVASATL